MTYLAALPNARRVLEHSGSLQAGERVVIVTDYEKITLAEIVAGAARTITGEVNLLVMVPRELDGEEPPEAIGAAMRHADLVVSLVARSITHTSAVMGALETGARALMLTAFTEAMLLGGGIEYDFRAHRPFCRRVADLLAGANTARLTTPAGTDLRMDLTGRPGNAHAGYIDGPGQLTTVPNVEASTSPVEGTSRGTIVGDASIPYYDIGLLTEPVRMLVEDGRVTSISGGRQAEQIARQMAEQHDPNVYNIAQLSFGLNPLCRMQGVMLEDEGVYGTSHIGIGTSSLLGGTVKAKMHFDVIMWHPTLELDGEVVLRDGQWLIGADIVANAISG
ncbi:MAG: leucyl aminopeptidase [Chloroflexi bacterium]|nr:leucyl aminopeptidase [Chloroflexota bacterium]